MIVVDPSAMVAVLLAEPGSELLEQRLLVEQCVMSAAGRVELGIVIEGRAGPAGTVLLAELLRRIGLVVEPADADTAAMALDCWRRFGRGRHRAALNFGDVFSYPLAMRLGCGLLFVGDDFAHTDVVVA